MRNRTRTTFWLALGLAAILAGGALAAQTPRSGDAADLAPAVDRPATGDQIGRAPARPGPEALRGAKVPTRRFPQRIGDAPNVVLYDNGPLVTHPGGGGGGADASRLQNSTLTMTILGFGHQITAGNWVADDFTISDAGGWQIDTITFFAYQTGSTTTSTINDIRLRIWDGIPGAPGSNIVFGDTTTNRLASTTWTNIYRDTETTPGVTNRPIMEVVATVGTTLDVGTYWLDWQEGGTLASGPWAPPVTIIGQTTTGDGLQSTDGGVTYVPVTDVGGQGFPFVVEGSIAAAPDITLDKTVGDVPGVCATTDTITVPYGTTVEYCFTVTNTGNVALNFHDLEDDHLGTLLSNFPYVLNPGDSVEVLAGDTATATVTNTATWTAVTSIGGYAIDDTIAPNFIDISGTGTSFTLGDDQVGGPFPIGFTFDYFGVGYTDAYPSSNGFMTFLPGQTSGCCTGQVLPTAGNPDGLIAGWWEDLDPAEPGAGLYYETQGSAPNRVFILQFTNVQHWPSGTPVTFQYQLHENGNVAEVHYVNAASDGGTHSAGVENETGTVGLQYFRGTTPLPAPLGVRYSPETPVGASATDSATVTVTMPDIAVDPASIERTVSPGGTSSASLFITNNGDADLDWTIAEAVPTPLLGGESPLGSTAYAHNAANDTYVTLDVAVPDVLVTVAPYTSAGFVGAGEYIGGSVYMLDGGGNLAELDAVTGAVLNTLSAPPPAGQTWTGMAVDPTDGTVYAASSTCAVSSLSTIDVTTGAVTAIGPLTNAPCIIGIAVDGNGDLWGYEIVGDVWLSIDKATGAGTVIGPIGFNANFGQGLGWDAATDTLYMAAFNSTTGQPELRTVDRTTGNSTFVGILGSTVPGGTNQLGWIGFEIGFGPCSSPSDVPWLSVAPSSGTTPPLATSTVDVDFDATGLTVGTYDALLCVDSNDPDTPRVEVPVTMLVDDSMPFLDGFETGDTSRWSFSVP